MAVPRPRRGGGSSPAFRISQARAGGRWGSLPWIAQEGREPEWEGASDSYDLGIQGEVRAGVGVRGGLLEQRKCWQQQEISKQTDFPGVYPRWRR